MALDVEEYRDRLIKERDELTRELGGVAEVGLGTPADSDNDTIEVAQNAPMIDVEASIVELKSDRLENINAALQNIEDGTYGSCIKCGKPIDPRRLDADPAALLCIEDASAEEANFVAPAL